MKINCGALKRTLTETITPRPTDPAVQHGWRGAGCSRLPGHAGGPPATLPTKSSGPPPGPESKQYSLIRDNLQPMRSPGSRTSTIESRARAALLQGRSRHVDTWSKRPEAIARQWVSNPAGTRCIGQPRPIRDDAVTRCGTRSITERPSGTFDDGVEDNCPGSQCCTTVSAWQHTGWRLNPTQARCHRPASAPGCPATVCRSASEWFPARQAWLRR
jgi:hypothetical protein